MCVIVELSGSVEESNVSQKDTRRRRVTRSLARHTSDLSHTSPDDIQRSLVSLSRVSAWRVSACCARASARTVIGIRQIPTIEFQKQNRVRVTFYIYPTPAQAGAGAGEERSPTQSAHASAAGRQLRRLTHHTRARHWPLGGTLKPTSGLRAEPERGAPPASAVPQQTQGVAAAAPNEEALASLRR